MSCATFSRLHGVRRLVLLSSYLIERDGGMIGGVQDWPADNAPEWAILRPSWFMQNFSGGPTPAPFTGKK